jgi:phosphopantothenoylcysteine decarboxylase
LKEAMLTPATDPATTSTPTAPAVGAGTPDRPAPATADGQLPERLLLGVSGSVASLALPTHLHTYRSAGISQIVVVMTPTAEQFLPAATLRLVADAVYTEDDHGRGHVALARWPDSVLVLPATAHLIGCLAHGLAPNLLSTTLLASARRAVIAPAMNPVMWQQHPVQRNIAQLRADGHLVLTPQPGPAYEVASRTVTQALALPGPEQVLTALGATCVRASA